MENGGAEQPPQRRHRCSRGSSRDLRLGRTTHDMSSLSLRKKLKLRKSMVKVLRGLFRQARMFRKFFLGAKLSVLFPATPLAIAAQCYNFGRANCVLHWPNSGRITHWNMWKCNRAYNSKLRYMLSSTLFLVPYSQTTLKKGSFV